MFTKRHIQVNVTISGINRLLLLTKIKKRAAYVSAKTQCDTRSHADIDGLLIPRHHPFIAHMS